ncbi:hypothetical protein YC2023_032327 [Brassica napus]
MFNIKEKNPASQLSKNKTFIKKKEQNSILKVKEPRNNSYSIVRDIKQKQLNNPTLHMIRQET